MIFPFPTQSCVNPVEGTWNHHFHPFPLHLSFQLRNSQTKFIFRGTTPKNTGKTTRSFILSDLYVKPLSLGSPTSLPLVFHSFRASIPGPVRRTASRIRRSSSSPAIGRFTSLTNRGETSHLILMDVDDLNKKNIPKSSDQTGKYNFHQSWNKWNLHEFTSESNVTSSSSSV